MYFELDFLHALQSIHNDVLDAIMLFITRLGDGGFIWIVIGLLLLIVPSVGKESKEHLKQRRKAGLMILLSLALTSICVNAVLKNVVQRPRPFHVDTSVIPLIFPSGYSFPSGHTASAFAAATAIFLYRKKAGIVAFVLAAIIAFTRMYLFVHYPTDIIGGIVVGVICACIVNKLVKSYLRVGH